MSFILRGIPVTSTQAWETTYADFSWASISSMIDKGSNIIKQTKKLINNGFEQYVLAIDFLQSATNRRRSCEYMFYTCIDLDESYSMKLYPHAVIS